jgi:hypothetical protein
VKDIKDRGSLRPLTRAKGTILEIRPIYHQSDSTNAGHLFCSFLALLLRKELDERLVAASITAEWADIVRDLDRVEQITSIKKPSTSFYDLRYRPPQAACSRPSASAVCRFALVRGAELRQQAQQRRECHHGNLRFGSDPRSQISAASLRLAYVAAPTQFSLSSSVEQP